MRALQLGLFGPEAPAESVGTMIERYVFAGNRDAHAADKFARWLDGYKRLREHGWDVDVLVDHERTHAIALAYRTPQ